MNKRNEEAKRRLLIHGKTVIENTQTFASVWDAISDTPAEAENLRCRAEIMRQIASVIKEKEWKQAEAAKHCRVTQPRINDLLHGRISRFSLDALVNIASALGQRVNLELSPTTKYLAEAIPSRSSSSTDSL